MTKRPPGEPRPGRALRVSTSFVPALAACGRCTLTRRGTGVAWQPSGEDHRLPGTSARRHRVPVLYELRALAGRYEITAQAARGARSARVELPQGYGPAAHHQPGARPAGRR